MAEQHECECEGYPFLMSRPSSAFFLGLLTSSLVQYGIPGSKHLEKCFDITYDLLWPVYTDARLASAGRQVALEQLSAFGGIH